MELRVAEAFEITGRGTAVVFETDPDPGLPWRKHRVRIRSEGRASVETIGQVELVRKIPPGEVIALVFSELYPSDIPRGSTVLVLEAIAE